MHSIIRLLETRRGLTLDELAEIDELFRSINSVLPDRHVAHLERIARVSLPILHGARDYSQAAGRMELVSWVLSYGMHAEVLAPPELRKDVRRHVKEMRQQYRNKEKKPDKVEKKGKQGTMQ